MLRRLVACAMLASGSAHAATSCAVPAILPPAPVEQGERRVLPIEKFVLAWYWWPENCVRFPGEGCRQRFGFKVHGLWPDGAGQGYPQYCRSAARIAPATVRANWCMTPAVSLIGHEWAKHGTCNWATPEAYFADAKAISDALELPDADALTGRVTAGSLRDAIVVANPGLPRAALFVGTDRRQRLTEVRLCLDRRYRATACDGGRVGAPDRVPLKIRPRDPGRAAR